MMRRDWKRELLVKDYLTEESAEGGVFPQTGPIVVVCEVVKELQRTAKSCLIAAGAKDIVVRINDHANFTVKANEVFWFDQNAGLEVEKIIFTAADASATFRLFLI